VLRGPGWGLPAHEDSFSSRFYFLVSVSSTWRAWEVTYEAYDHAYGYGELEVTEDSGASFW